jgi:hypothetical protein
MKIKSLMGAVMRNKARKRLDALEQQLQPQGFKVFWQDQHNKDIYVDSEGNQYSIDEIRALPLKDVILVERVTKAVSNTDCDKAKGGEK